MIKENIIVNEKNLENLKINDIDNKEVSCKKIE